MIRRYHEELPEFAHQGCQRTYQAIRSRFYWPAMRQDVVTHVVNCNVCLQAKASVVQVPARQIVVPKAKFEVILIDIYGEGALSQQPQGRMILTVLDRLTNFLQLFPIKRKNWTQIGGILWEKWISVFGKPRMILLDNGFKGQLSTEWGKKHEIHLQYCAAHDHRQIGAVERVHRYLGAQILTLSIEEGKGCTKNAWPSYLPVISMRYNAGALAGLAISPYELVFGSHATGILKVDRKDFEYQRDQHLLKLLEKAAAAFRKKEYRQRVAKLKTGVSSHANTHPGSWVWWKKKTTSGGKFSRTFGPYEITSRPSDKLFVGRHVHTGREARLSAEQCVPCGTEW